MTFHDHDCSTMFPFHPIIYSDDGLFVLLYNTHCSLCLWRIFRSICVTWGSAVCRFKSPAKCLLNRFCGITTRRSSMLPVYYEINPMASNVESASMPWRHERKLVVLVEGVFKNKVSYDEFGIHFQLHRNDCYLFSPNYSTMSLIRSN